jgi:uncharacterized protein (TIGR02594 family)
MIKDAYTLAERFVGVKEWAEAPGNPLILAMLKLDNSWPSSDEVPWCSAFVNFVCWLGRLPRSKDLRARSWLGVGRGILIGHAQVGYDVVILNRGGSPNPDQAGPGHVGFFGGIEDNRVLVLGGNQSDAVSVARYPVSGVLGVRRLA